MYIVKFNSGHYLNVILDDFSMFSTGTEIKDAKTGTEYEMKNIANYLNQHGYKCEIILK